jgi:hypothetical protein
MNDELKFHPLADMFPLMEGAEFDALVADINENGVQQKIVLYQGKILDGRNRYRGMLTLEYTDEFIKADCKPLHEVLGYDKASDVPKDEARKWVISANIHRRHLTAEQKRDLILKCADWSKSDRAIAAEMKTNKNTVSRLRKKAEKATVSIETVGEAEATVPIGTVEKRVGKDGKARKQPAKEKRKPKAKREEADKAECVALWQKVQQAEAEIEKQAAATARRLVVGLPDVAREINEFTDDHWWPFMEALARELKSAKHENAADPEASAEAMKAKFAADDGLDIPECLRRELKAAAT